MKQYLTSLLFITLLSIFAMNQAHASIRSQLQQDAQKLVKLSEQPQLKQVLEGSNKTQNKMTKSSLAKLRQQWRKEVRLKKGPLIDSKTSSVTAKWLTQKQKLNGFYALLLSNRSGYSVSQTILTKSIRPRFASNALKKGLTTAKITRTYKEPLSKIRVVRITVPVRENNKTIGLLSALIKKPKSSRSKKG